MIQIADAIRMRRLPVRDQDRVVALWGATRDGQFANYPLSYDEARDLARRAAALACYLPARASTRIDPMLTPRSD